MFQKNAEQIDGEGFLKAIPLLKTSHLKCSLQNKKHSHQHRIKNIAKSSW